MDVSGLKNTNAVGLVGVANQAVIVITTVVVEAHSYPPPIHQYSEKLAFGLHITTINSLHHLLLTIEIWS